jgi:probable HAF family extracellular repeat protein
MSTNSPNPESSRGAICRAWPRHCGALLLTMAALALPLAAGAQVVALKYVVTDLGSLGSTADNATSANGINNAGQVVGTSKLAGDITSRAFRTAPNKPINPATDNLGTLGGSFSTGAAINNVGQVVGTSGTGAPGPFSSEVTRAYRADPGAAMIGLGTLAPSGGANGFNTSGANGISDAANVVGSATVPNLCSSSSHAFRTGVGALIDPATDNLGTLAPGNCRSSTGFGVNNQGMTVGDSATTILVAGGRPTHAFRHTAAGGIVDLSTLGGYESTAYAVNDLGEIVGKSNTAAGDTHAFLSQGNTPMIDIGTLGGSYSAASAINKRYPLDSQVIGSSSVTGNTAIHGFIYTGSVSSGGTMVDLNNLIAANSNWVIADARGINDNGQIVGAALQGGVAFVYHAVRLDPADVAVTVLTQLLSDPALALTDGQVNSLTDKLTNAFNSIRQGFNKQAINQLTALINSVQTWVKNGKITSTTAATLTAAAKAIIAVL